MKRRCRSLAFVYVLGLALGASFASAQTEITPGPGAVTASTQDANVPGNTVDGSLATRWSGSGDGAWLRFDLGSTRVISHVRIAVYQGNTRRNRFEIQLAGEDLAWTTVWTGESSGTTTGEQTYDFDDRAARYVRYVGSGSSAGAWNSVTEVSLFAPATPAPTPTSTPTPSPTPSASPTATPTPVTPTPTPGGPTNGWTQISWTYKVQKPYDVDVSSRFSHANGVWTCWVFKTDKPHTTTSNTAPRTEMRWNNDYTSGNRMWDGDIYPVGGIDDAHIQQVFGGVVHATASMIMVFADGTLKRYDTGTIATGVLDKWTNVKVAHDANANNVKIYVGNVLKRTDPDRGNTTHYFKNGVYGLSSPRGECRFRNLRQWTR